MATPSGQVTPPAAKASAQVTPPAGKAGPQATPPAAKASAQVTPPAAKASAKVPPPTVKANAQVPVAKANAPSAPAKTGKPAEAQPGEQTVVIRAPAMPAKRETAAEETMVIRLSTSTVSKTATIAPVVIPGEADTKVLRPPMPALVPPKPPRPLDALAPERERRTRPRPNGLGHAPWILALSSLGVVLVALGYAGGRYQTSYAIAAYWIGQVVVFTPVVLRLLSRRLAGVAESFILVLGLALNQYLLKWFYSPDQFRFPDELQHWLATTIINDTGELFQPNLALPPAVHFPGLAEMGAAVSQLTGLSVYDSGILVAGVAHLCFVGALFALVLRASGSPTIAGVSCVVYATTLHYLFFNSMYLYQTAALPFFMITVWAVRRWRAGGGWPFLAIAVVGIGLTTVSHHVTAVALVATLVLLGVTEFVAEKSWPWRALLAPLIAVGMVAAWILLVARDVITYLEAPLDQVMKTASMFVTDHSDATTVTPAVSIWQLAVQGLGLIFLLVLFLALARDTLARHERDSWRWSILAGTAVFFVGNAVRFLGSNGPEIAGRLSTFTYVPISVVAAIALVHAVELIPRHRDAKGRRWLAVSPLPAAAPANRTFTPRVVTGGAIITVLMIGARVGGWPPPNQLLPGPYLAAGFERSVDELGISAARWQYETLGPGNRVGGDLVSVSLSSTYGRQDPVREVGALYYDGVWSGADDEMVTDLALSYLVVDSRLSEQLPTNQAYFESDPHAGRITDPLTKGQIGKFDTLPAVSRLYDNGTIRIYRMGES